MKGIYVNSSSVPYADLIVSGKKTIETRSRNMLFPCLFERVAVIKTGCGPAQVVGYVEIHGYRFNVWKRAADAYEQTFVPEGSKYANNKWFYLLRNPVKLEEPFLLSKGVIRHGRSWCEF